MAGGGGEEEDYMGDLSIFLPPDAPFSKKVSGPKPSTPAESKRKKLKGSNWQEQRKIDRERKQREEDEKTLEGMEAAIPPSNVGFKMLQNMGYSPGSALGKEGIGRSEPVSLEIRRSRAGIGRRSPTEEKASVEKYLAERKRRREEEMMEEYGSRQKTNWRSRRIYGDYRKAEAALAQLENREIVEPDKDDDDGEKKPEEEEEVITEEDLQDILVKLREEHHYCLYCGCQYESMGALQDNCPGLNEEDH